MQALCENYLYSFPSQTVSILSAYLASERLCVIRMTVLPHLWRERSNSITSFPERLSRFPHGSSARIRSGSAAIALAIATRCCCPPESSYGLCDSLRSPTASSAESERSRRLLSGYLCKVRGNATFFNHRQRRIRLND